MLTIESTATVDEAHRLTLAVPASVPPGAHRVTVVIRDCQPPGSPASRGPMRAVPDFVAQQRAAGMKMFTKEEAEAFDRWLAGESEQRLNVRPYADTNFFTRRLLPVPGNEEAVALASQAKVAGMDRLPVTWLLEIELANAIEHGVFVSRTSGQFRVSPEAAAAAHALLAEDIAQGGFLAPVALEVDALKHAARELALRHTARRGFRTYDLVHVSSALLLGCDTFWSFDAKARLLAQAEGLAVNPPPVPPGA